ncbi:hypothetical protein KC19_VG252300 [Ceratodon purpureus]|uniref:Uncharacterized protein n=1 Tax=Ceratodon purpureus TaxID=3225 RepID=A0A8T0HTF9_CERPU|nr:hypothetical protein KC19_VG252300 [Ceratodon purpureus]
MNSTFSYTNSRSQIVVIQGQTTPSECCVIQGPKWLDTLSPVTRTALYRRIEDSLARRSQQVTPAKLPECAFKQPSNASSYVVRDSTRLTSHSLRHFVLTS